MQPLLDAEAITAGRMPEALVLALPKDGIRDKRRPDERCTQPRLQTVIDDVANDQQRGIPVVEPSDGKPLHANRTARRVARASQTRRRAAGDA